MRRTWIPTDTSNKTEIGTVEFYDFGTVCGHLIDDEWKSWEIISRIDSSGCIIEELKELSQDYVPFILLHQESHPIYEMTANSLIIPGWTVQVSQVSQNSEKVIQVQKVEPRKEIQINLQKVDSVRPRIAPRPPPRPVRVLPKPQTEVVEPSLKRKPKKEREQRGSMQNQLPQGQAASTWMPLQTPAIYPGGFQLPSREQNMISSEALVQSSVQKPKHRKKGRHSVQKGDRPSEGSA